MNYRHHFSEKESDVTIISDSKQAILKAKEALSINRKELELYVSKHESFLTSFSPVKAAEDSSRIIDLMVDASERCGVGPMAAVAGALADLMLEAMFSMPTQNERGYIVPKNALVENGGEIIIDTKEPMKIGLYAGFNRLNLNLGFLIEEKDCPIGIGTSSATIGHAVSLGQADSVSVFAENAAIGDAAATKICNLVKGDDIERSIKAGLDALDEIDGAFGAFICREDKIGQAGNLPKIIKIEGDREKIIVDKLSRLLSDDFELLE